MDEYQELTVVYLQTKQRLSALADWKRIEQIRLEKYYQRTQNTDLFAQIEQIENERYARIEAVRLELNDVIQQMTESDYQTKHFLTTPFKQALFAHNLK